MDSETGGPSPLTPLQKQIYESANERYAAKHFAAASVEIVDTVPAHYDPLRGLLLRAYEPVVPTMYSDGYAEELTDLESRANSTTMFTALLNGHIVGTITYIDDAAHPLHLFADTCAAYMRFLAVDPSAQRTGAGSLLTKRCIEQANVQNRPRIGLHTLPTMTAAINLYVSLGFERSTSNDGLSHVGYDGEAPAFIKPLS